MKNKFFNIVIVSLNLFFIAKSADRINNRDRLIFFKKNMPVEGCARFIFNGYSLRNRKESYDLLIKNSEKIFKVLKIKEEESFLYFSKN